MGAIGPRGGRQQTRPRRHYAASPQIAEDNFKKQRTLNVSLSPRIADPAQLSAPRGVINERVGHEFFPQVDGGRRNRGAGCPVTWWICRRGSLRGCPGFRPE